MESWLLNQTLINDTGFSILMQIFTKDDFENRKDIFVEKIKNGEVFIYPTDTIYGIGCDATNIPAVEKVRQIKGQYDRPLSVMVPDKEWIVEYCNLTHKEEDWVHKLPGPYTLILNTKNGGVADNVTDKDTLGVRIPDHWCTELSNLAGVPIITTSANKTGGNFMTSYAKLDPLVEKHIDFMIDVGEVRGRPSSIINLTEDNVKIIKRI